MEDHSVSSEDDDDLIEPADEVIISYYLKMMMNNGKSWPNHFLRDEYAHMYNLNPNYFVKTQSPNYFVFVAGESWLTTFPAKRASVRHGAMEDYVASSYPFVLYMGHYFFVNKIETSGRTDGCHGGCWRMIRHDKAIISTRTKEVLGFKRFYHFYHSEKPKFAKPAFKSEEDEVKVTWAALSSLMHLVSKETRKAIPVVFFAGEQFQTPTTPIPELDRSRNEVLQVSVASDRDEKPTPQEKFFEHMVDPSRLWINDNELSPLQLRHDCVILPASSKDDSEEKRSACSAGAERVWEPGGLPIKAARCDWLDEYQGKGDMLQFKPKISGANTKTLSLLIEVLKIKFQSDDVLSFHDGILVIRRLLSSGVYNRVWEPGEHLTLLIALLVEHCFEEQENCSIHGSFDDTIAVTFDPGGVFQEKGISSANPVRESTLQSIVRSHSDGFKIQFKLISDQAQEFLTYGAFHLQKPPELSTIREDVTFRDGDDYCHDEMQAYSKTLWFTLADTIVEKYQRKILDNERVTVISDPNDGRLLNFVEAWIHCECKDQGVTLNFDDSKGFHGYLMDESTQEANKVLKGMIIHKLVWLKHTVFQNNSEDDLVILGYKWLLKLGETLINGKDKTMSFYCDARWVSISGTKITLKSDIALQEEIHLVKHQEFKTEYGITVNSKLEGSAEKRRTQQQLECYHKESMVHTLTQLCLIVAIVSGAIAGAQAECMMLQIESYRRYESDLGMRDSIAPSRACMDKRAKVKVIVSKVFVVTAKAFTMRIVMLDLASSKIVNVEEYPAGNMEDGVSGTYQQGKVICRIRVLFAEALDYWNRFEKEDA
ncbi:unnamed protein product, partial [Thlaspi arvense]